MLFAGEHATTVHPGTTHGAWATGLSAAEAILKHASGQCVAAEDLAKLRMQLHEPRPESVLEVPFLRSRRKQWSRLQRLQRP